MKNNLFRFKRFEVSHSRSSMKVGVDAVLLGAWGGTKAANILEVGTGCGVISLMLAQRFPEAFVDALDIDKPSVDEASENFRNSEWNERLRAWQASFPTDLGIGYEGKYDLIVSNPPYFDSGLKSPVTSREKARHQDSLSVFTLLNTCYPFLSEYGTLSVIFPAEDYSKAITEASKSRMIAVRECWIRNRLDLPYKRVMIDFKKIESAGNYPADVQHLVLFEKGNPTKEYQELCRNFYLKF